MDTTGRVIPNFWSIVLSRIQYDIRINPDRFEPFQDVIQSNTIPRLFFV